MHVNGVWIVVLYFESSNKLGFEVDVRPQTGFIVLSLVLRFAILFLPSLETMNRRKLPRRAYGPQQNLDDWTSKLSYTKANEKSMFGLFSSFSSFLFFRLSPKNFSLAFSRLSPSLLPLIILDRRKIKRCYDESLKTSPSSEVFPQILWLPSFFAKKLLFPFFLIFFFMKTPGDGFDCSKSFQWW